MPSNGHSFLEGNFKEKGDIQLVEKRKKASKSEHGLHAKFADTLQIFDVANYVFVESLKVKFV